MGKYDSWYSYNYLYHDLWANGNHKLDYIFLRSTLEELSQTAQCRYYGDELNELLNMVAYLENDIDRTIASFDSLPCRNQRSEYEPGVYWFNAVIALYNGTDMECLQENEYDYTTKEFQYRMRKLNAVFSLDKSTMIKLISTVLSLVFRYFTVKTTIEALVGIDEEMQYRQSLFKKNDKVILANTEYL